MLAQAQVRSADLPLPLAMELQDLRHRYAAALQEAAAGRFTRERELDTLSRRLGRVLAREARKPTHRRGITMREVSLAVARLFPEVREWSVQKALRARMASPADPAGVHRAS